MSTVCVAFTLALRKSSAYNHHVLSLPVLRALHHVIAAGFLSGVLVHALLSHGSEIALVDEIESDGPARGLRIQRHGHVDESEGDGAFPDNAGHGGSFPVLEISAKMRLQDVESRTFSPKHGAHPRHATGTLGMCIANPARHRARMPPGRWRLPLCDVKSRSKACRCAARLPVLTRDGTS